MKAVIVALLLATAGLVTFLVSTEPESVNFDEIDITEIRAAREACLATQEPSVPEGTTPVSIPAVPQAWFPGVGGEGYSRLTDGRLHVHFDRITIRSSKRANPYTPIAEQFVEGVQVGLATGEPRERRSQGGASVVVRWANMLHINQTISPGDTLQFDNYATSFFVADLPELDDYYLVLKADTTYSFDFYRPTYAPENPELNATRKRGKCRDI